jgi:hypothetical protein
VLRQKKERFDHLLSRPIFREPNLSRKCTLSLAHPKQSEPKEKGAR